MVVVEVSGFLVLVSWLTKSYVAEVFAEKPSIENLRLATRLDPGNSDFQLRLARLLRYSLTDGDLEQATLRLNWATGLNSRDPAPWLDLAAALESAGKTVDAQACLRRADLLAPNDPTNQWAIGNAFLLQGNTDEAFRHFRMVLAGSSEYNQILFNTAWKASGDPQKILDQLIPHDANTEFTYLYYLTSSKRYAEAQTLWQRITTSSETFLPNKAAAYMDTLLAAHRSDDAYRVWTDLRNKGLIKGTYEETDENLVINGDFEESLLNMGFDWRVVPLDGVGADVDETIYHSPGHSFLIEFSGSANVDYRNLYQYVRVVPGRSYQLRGYMKTEEITADSGPRLEVRDVNDPAVLDKFSEELTGTSVGWMPETVVFTTGPRTNLLIVGVSRLHSRKFDSLIAGKVWVDDISLTDIHKETDRPGEQRRRHLASITQHGEGFSPHRGAPPRIIE